MTGPGDGFVLAVDLGTSHTVAMLRWPDGRTRPLLFDGQPLMPSAVFLDTERRLHVGRDAQRLGYADPARIEPNPKRHIDDGVVLLGDVDVPVAELLAALLGAVAREAVATTGFLPPAVLTFPAAWGHRRRAVLTEALGRAGWPAETELVPEPVAAARYFADVLRRPVPVGSALAVFDFGGGTLDVAVVRNEGLGPDGRPRFEVAASGGADDLGGLDLDAALIEHLGKALAGGEPEAWAALTDPRSLAQWRARRQFWEDVRGAKEMLSRSALAPVPVPLVEQAVHLTRDELEACAGPLIRRGVAEAGAVLKAAGLAPADLAGLFLVGGSTRVPLVARLLHSELGIAPTVLEQPELPVAEGAIAAVVAAQAAGGVAVSPAASAAPATMAAPAESGRHAAEEPRFRRGVAEAATPTPTPATIPSQPPSYESPLGPPAPDSGEPPPDYAEPVDPWATGEAAAFGPNGGPPFTGGGGPSTGGHTRVGGSNETWLASKDEAPPGAPASPGAPRRPGVKAYRRKGFLIVAAGLVVVLLVGVGAAWYFWPGYRAVDFQALAKSPAKTLTPGVPVYSSSFADVKVLGDRAYFANQGEDGTLGVVAADTATGEQKWSNTEAGASEPGWETMIAVPGAVAVFTKPDTTADTRRMFVLDAGDGHLRWHREVAADDDIKMVGDHALWVDKTARRLVALRVSDGEQAWDLPDVKTEGGDTTALYGASTTADVSGPGDANGFPFAFDADDDKRLLQVLADRSARVIDGSNGDVLVAPKPGVAAPDTPLMVHNGRVVVAEKATNTQRILAFDLDTLGTPRVLGSVDPKVDISRMTPCGADAACWVETTGYDAKSNQVGGAKIAEGGSIWHVPAANAEYLMPVGENVLVSQIAQPTAKTSLISAAGKVQWTVDGQGGRVDGGNVLLFSKLMTDSVDDPALTGRHVGDDPVELGPLAQVRPWSCSWNTEVIACFGDEDLRVQRFTA